MFLFWKRNKKIKVELTHFIFNKTDNIYSLSSYFQMETCKKTYSVSTVIKNIPVFVENGKVVARVRYTGIPDGIVYFLLNLSNIQKGYVSTTSDGTNTIDVIVDATIKNEKCTYYKFDLIPVCERRVLSCQY